jgi:methylmalonyl-CoA epimerase
MRRRSAVASRRVPGQQVRAAFFAEAPAGQEIRLELLEPSSTDSPVAKFVETRIAKRGRGNAPHRLLVENIQERLDTLRKHGIRLIDDTPRNGALQTQIAFLHPPGSGGLLTELCEPRR